MRSALALIVFFVLAQPAEAICVGPNPWVPTTGHEEDIVACVTNPAFVNGDTIQVPAGTFSWDTTTTFNKCFVLQGAGTVIADDVLTGSNWVINLQPNCTTRITGFVFQDGARAAELFAPAGFIRVVGSNTDGGRFRFDHNQWNELIARIVTVNVIGVIDHNAFALPTGYYLLVVYGTTWDGGTCGNGSVDDAPSSWGGGDKLFVEDNTFTRPAGKSTTSITDGFQGGRVVIRHNVITRGTTQHHGNDTPACSRGGQAWEVHDNLFDNTGGEAVENHLHTLRSGGAVLYNNIGIAFAKTANPYAIQIDRMIGIVNSPFGAANGLNPWDVNGPTIDETATVTAYNATTRTATLTGLTTTCVDNGCAGYALNKLTAGCNVPMTSSDAGTNVFTTGRAHGLNVSNSIWIGGHTAQPFISGIYTVATTPSPTTLTLTGIDVTTGGTGGWTSLSAAANNCSTVILASTDTTVTRTNLSFTGMFTLNPGDLVRIDQVIDPMDSPGRSGGSLITGTTATRTGDMPAGWNDQVNSCAYEQNNIINGVEADQAFSTVLYSRVFREGEQLCTDQLPPGYVSYTYPHPLTMTGGAKPHPATTMRVR